MCGAAATQGAGQPSLGQLDYNDFLEIMKIKMNEKPTREQLSKGEESLALGTEYFPGNCEACKHSLRAFLSIARLQMLQVSWRLQMGRMLSPGTT